MHQNYKLGNRPEWILRLLYACKESGSDSTITGRTRLMKGAFLLQTKLEEEFGEETDFHFKPDKYGPFDKGVYFATEDLERDGLLEIEEKDKYEEDIYRLTDEGEEKAKQLFEALPDEEQQLLKWLCARHLGKQLSQLLSFVYNRYPDMAEKSKLT